MSDNSTDPSATQNPPATPAAPPTAPAAPAAAPPKAGDLPDEALRQRLERERAKGGEEAVQAMLSKLGVTSEADISAALTAFKAAQDAAKTTEEKLAELNLVKEQISAKTAQYETIIKARATAELSELTDEQTNAVKAIAGDDPAQQLKAIDALKPTWKQGPTAAPEPAPPAPPADTAPARAAAPDATNQSPPDHKAVWEAMQKTNPFAAAAYYQKHRTEIFPSQ